MMGVDIPISVCRHKINIVSWPEAVRRPHPMVYDFVNNIYTRPELGETSSSAGSTRRNPTISPTPITTRKA